MPTCFNNNLGVRYQHIPVRKQSTIANVAIAFLSFNKVAFPSLSIIPERMSKVTHIIHLVVFGRLDKLHRKVPLSEFSSIMDVYPNFIESSASVLL